MRLEADVETGRGRFALRASFTVEDRTVLAVLGPNGAGKSTLLRALAGLLPLDAGRIALRGGAQPVVLDDPAAGVFVPVERRGVGMVFQDHRLFPHLSVRDNVAYPVRIAGRGTATARAEADAWLARLGLEDLARRRPAQLSGGQAQRVALARALARQPRLLLLDEPLAALDARTRIDVRAELRRHLADHGGPTLLVTHDPIDALVLGDRVLVLESGHVVQEGIPTEVARRPATEYVARLVGLNLYPGTLLGPDGQVLLDAGGVLEAAGSDPADLLQGPDAALPGPAALAAGTPVLVAVAPSAVAVHLDRPSAGSPRNLWPATVTGVEQLADRIRVALDGAPPAIADITAHALAELRLEPGARVWLSVKATEVVAYPAPRVRRSRGSRPSKLSQAWDEPSQPY